MSAINNTFKSTLRRAIAQAFNGDVKGTSKSLQRASHFSNIPAKEQDELLMLATSVKYKNGRVKIIDTYRTRFLTSKD